MSPSALFLRHCAHTPHTQRLYQLTFSVYKRGIIYSWVLLACISDIEPLTRAGPSLQGAINLVKILSTYWLENYLYTKLPA